MHNKILFLGDDTFYMISILVHIKFKFGFEFSGYHAGARFLFLYVTMFNFTKHLYFFYFIKHFLFFYKWLIKHLNFTKIYFDTKFNITVCFRYMVLSPRIQITLIRIC